MTKFKMKHVKLADITFGERFRDDLGDIEELMESIKEKGVIQPICISTDGVLLAGGRRFTACQNLGLAEIPAIIRESAGEIDNREIELMENIHRKDMTWQEKAKLTAEIDSLYKAKNKDWSGRKTAGLLGKSAMTVSNNLRLAGALDVLPELGQCKTADDAMKVLKKAEENAIVAELAKRQQARVEAIVAADVPQAEGDSAAMANALLLAQASADYEITDVFEKMAGLPDNGRIDFIECDPPYGINLHKGSDDGNYSDSITKRLKYATYKDIPPGEYPDFLARLLPELYRIAAPNSSCIFWLSMNYYPTVLALAEAAGWKVDKTPAVWLKENGSKSMNLDTLTRGYEPFLYLRKGQPTIYIRGRRNTFFASNDSNAYHPAQRPILLMQQVLETFCPPTGTTFVPFLGSGATLRAAYLQGKRAFGTDLNDEYKDRFLLAVEEDSKRKA